MEKYEDLKLEVIFFEEADVIRTSGDEDIISEEMPA